MPQELEAKPGSVGRDSPGLIAAVVNFLTRAIGE
jgi:hypothetical protein